MTNIGWKEFMHQYGLIYGKHSKVYNSLFPDTTGYFKRISEDRMLSDRNSFLSKSKYFHHYIYNNYPVRGISLEQAIIYSKWRSSRVLEAILIMANIPFPKKTKRKKQSILEYFKKNVKSSEYRDLVKAIPHFYIPNVKEFELVKSKLLKKEIKMGVKVSVKKRRLAKILLE